jgi:hypothetical protein
MTEWEPVQDQNTTGLSERWQKVSGEYEFRIFYKEDHVLDVPEEIRGLPWILVIRKKPEGGIAEYVYWSAQDTDGSAKDLADLWESNNV